VDREVQFPALSQPAPRQNSVMEFITSYRLSQALYGCTIMLLGIPIVNDRSIRVAMLTGSNDISLLFCGSASPLSEVWF
jgi:hypothetical protein